MIPVVTILSLRIGWILGGAVIVAAWLVESKQQVVEKTGNLVAATFLHDVNRNNEPQLHVHADRKSVV